MRALRGGIPRAFRSHKSAEGAAYRAYVRSWLQQLGPLPAHLLPTLREAGRLTVELAAIGTELETARQRKRRRDIARLRRSMIPMRTQLLNLERRLEEVAGRNGHLHRDPLANVRAAVQQATRKR